MRKRMTVVMTEPMIAPTTALKTSTDGEPDTGEPDVPDTSDRTDRTRPIPHAVPADPQTHLPTPEQPTPPTPGQPTPGPTGS